MKEQTSAELPFDALEKAVGGTGFNPRKPPNTTKNVCPSCNQETVITVDVTVTEGGVTHRYNRQCTKCKKFFFVG